MPKTSYPGQCLHESSRGHTQPKTLPVHGNETNNYKKNKRKKVKKRIDLFVNFQKLHK